MYLWLDLETTGLDPRTDRILEVAWVPSHTDFNTANNRVEDALITTGIVARDLIENNDVVRKMHEDSGLLDDLRVLPTMMLSDAEDKILATMDGWEAEHGECHDDQKWYLAGSSIQFDLSFVQVWMSRLYKRLHYRILDVSTLKAFFSQFVQVDESGPIVCSDGFEVGVPHRAAYDIKVSMATANVYRSALSEAHEVMAALDELENLGRR